MSGLKPSESIVEKCNILQASYGGMGLSGSEAHMINLLWQLDWHGRKLGSTTTQPFQVRIDRQRFYREHYTYSQIGYSFMELLSWNHGQIQECFSAYQVNPYIQLITDKLQSLQQDIGYTLHRAHQHQLAKQCLNEIRVAVRSPEFVIRNNDWNRQGRQNLAMQKTFLRQAVRKFNTVSLLGLEINQTGLHPRGTSFNPHDLHEVEIQRSRGLTEFIKRLEQEVFKDKLAGTLCSSGFDAYKGLCNRFQLVLLVDEEGNIPLVNLEQLNEVWQQCNLPNPVTAEGACLRSQVCMDVHFGRLADGDAIRQNELKEHLEMLHEREHYRRYDSTVFAPCTQIHRGAIMLGGR